MPKEVAKEFPDTEYFDVTVEEGKIILLPIKIVPADITLESVREKLKNNGITEGDVAEAITWTRKKK